VLKEVSDQFEAADPVEILRWGVENFAPKLALSTGFGPEGVVLMHLLSQIAPETTVFYLDTDLLFEETYELRDKLTARLGIQFTRVHSGISLEAQSAEFGPALWSHNPDQCCNLRKVVPLRRFLATQKAWITAIRRDQTTNRANAGLVEWDKTNGLVKLNPLANWSHKKVWAHVMEHSLPYNPLHDQGYPSIGCWPCTKAVAAGADPRSGRWAGLEKTECGIHLQDEKS
jgi:phosphoadenosine phosphosulfate reductase